MLVLGMAAAIMSIAAPNWRSDMVAVGRQVPYRIGPQRQSEHGYRATPILDALVVSPRLRLRGRRSEFLIANLSFAVEGQRRAHGGRAGPDGRMNASRAPRAPDWRDAKELAFAVGADWLHDSGRWRLGGGIDRMALVNPALSGGRTGITVRVLAADYVSDAGWSIGCGWRTIGIASRRSDAGRLAALAAGAPMQASGGYIGGTAVLADRSSLRIEGSSARLGADDARLLGRATDQRVTLSLHHRFP